MNNLTLITPSFSFLPLTENISDDAPVSGVQQVGTVAPAPVPKRTRRHGRRATREEIACREVAWFHSDDARSDRNGVADARAKIGGWIAAMRPWHRGALALANDRRELSAVLEDATSESVALIVRLDCIAHAGVGSRDTLERAAVARLEEKVRDEGEDALASLENRAFELTYAAMRAYRKVRGKGRCALPSYLPVRASVVSRAAGASDPS